MMAAYTKWSRKFTSVGLDNLLGKEKHIVVVNHLKDQTDSRYTLQPQEKWLEVLKELMLQTIGIQIITCTWSGMDSSNQMDLEEQD